MSGNLKHADKHSHPVLLLCTPLKSRGFNYLFIGKAKQSCVNTQHNNLNNKSLIKKSDGLFCCFKYKINKSLW